MDKDKKPRPGRRRIPIPLRATSPFGSIRDYLLLILCLTLLHQTTGLETPEQLKAARRGVILTDTRPAPTHRRLHKRQEGTATSATASASTRSTSASVVFIGTTTLASPSSSQSASSSASSVVTSIVSDTSGSTPSTLPQPFDASLGNNFTTSSCPAFFDKFLDDSTFQSCLPLSLLLQNSVSFFTASHSLPRITQTLDATCNVDLPQCNTLMNTLANQLRSPSNCGADYNLQNPQVLQAYDGFVSYALLYHAGCLKDATTGNYCFASAITNTTTPTNSYVYYLPLGLPLPGSSRPSCTTCLQDTMAVFSTQASNRSQPLSGVYNNAATQIDLGCGPDFVNSTVAVSGGSRGIPTRKPTLSLLLLLSGILAMLVVCRVI